MTCAIAHSPILRICPGVIRGLSVDRELTPFAGSSRLISRWAYGIFCKFISTDRCQSKSQQPVARSAVGYFPSAYKALIGLQHGSVWGLLVTDEGHVVTSIRERTGIRRWRKDRACRRGRKKDQIRCCGCHACQRRERDRAAARRRQRRDRRGACGRRRHGGLCFEEIGNDRSYSRGQRRSNIRRGRSLRLTCTRSN